jgi:hypothetical protein
MVATSHVRRSLRLQAQGTRIRTHLDSSYLHGLRPGSAAFGDRRDSILRVRQTARGNESGVVFDQGGSEDGKTNNPRLGT